MRILGCGLRAREQTFAMLDTVTGAVVNRSLRHKANQVSFALSFRTRSRAVLHYSQTFCKYGAPAITLPGLHGIALKYS